MARPRKVSASFARVRRAERRLYDWLRQHHDDFAAELERTNAHDRWRQAMAVITEHQLLDARGKPPTKDTAVETWKRVCADVAADRARKQRIGEAGPALQPGEIAPGVRAVGTGWTGSTGMALGTARPSTAAAPLPRPAPAAGPADLDHPASHSVGSGGAAPVTAEQSRNAADRMQDLLGSMRAGKVPLPKTI